MDPAFPVLVFGPGLPSTGQRGELRSTATGIQVSWAGADWTLRVPLPQLQLREAGFGRPGLELSWTEGDRQWAVHVLDPTAAAALRSRPEWLAAPQARALGDATRRRTAWRGVGYTLLALLVLGPLLLLALAFLQAERIAGWVVQRVPVEHEVALGRAAFASMRGTLRLDDGGARLAAVESLGKRLTAGSRYRYEFHVTASPEVNAFALPGGIVVVNAGLIAATRRPEELAGVLAHEVQHVELRHSTRAIVKDLGWRAAWALVTGDVAGTWLGQVAAQLGSLKFSRDAEREADARGFDALVAAGIDPSGMVSFFGTLAAKSGGPPAEFLSTHPLSAEREAALQQKSAALGPRQFAPLQLGQWPPR